MIDLHLQKQLSGPAGPMDLDAKLSIRTNALVALTGPSGAGKTSLLRMIAGLMQPDTGRLIVGDQTWYDHASNIFVKPQERSAGFLFQDYALFPNMTVRKNLEFALTKGAEGQAVDTLIDIMELTELQHRKPDTLSGGQQQRVALARSLVQRPRVLLLDEPLAALDRAMRIKLQNYLIEAHRRYGLTTILVSHDVAEILRLANRMLVMENGRIVQDGKPAEILTRSELSGKFQFVGEILAINQQDVIMVLTILVGTEVVRVVMDPVEAAELAVGDQVLVASKAFNPVIRKL